ncbi:MAG: carbohydrate esterase [Paludibacter sp.]|jgi:pectin methylesterase-like acyl-CoA thioesterase|nr:carbohydrate esterase [Paludibacter sp.]
MKSKIFISFFAVILLYSANVFSQSVTFFPVNAAKNVNPDVQLKITFLDSVKIGETGFIRVFDNKTGKQVDMLDLSIPAGPLRANPAANANADYTKTPYKYEITNATNKNTVAGTPSGEAIRDTAKYQLTIIGGFTDGFHFYPIITKGKTATIYLHNNLLEYDKTYYVTVDKSVFRGNFSGIKKGEWTFSTRNNAPAKNVRNLIVSADGSGDFNTVQGAIDFIPDFSSEKWDVFVKNGDYEELVYFRNKRNVTIKGESRDGVRIHYANCEVFNPHPINLKTNEARGTFPSRRAAFAADNCSDLRFENITIQTTMYGQAEGLLLMGERLFLKNVHIIGSGDALQVNGSAYFTDCLIDGDGDSVLGRGAAFFNNCTLTSGGPFMWIRNTAENHGNVFLNCVFKGKGQRSVIARSPKNGGKTYPFAEAVLLNCKLENIPEVGWGDIHPESEGLHFWEYNSQTADGQTIDASKRHPMSRRLDKEKDAEIIKNYSNPRYILNWNDLEYF